MNLLYPILAVLYLIMPYDLLPDAFVGWGWIDDVVVLWFLWRYLARFRGGSLRAGSEDNSASFENKKHGTGRDRQDQSESRGAGGHAGASGARDPHRILGVAPDASPDEIRQAYRELANKYHPDKVMHLGEEFRVLAEARFKEIQEAYQELQVGVER